MSEEWGRSDAFWSADLLDRRKDAEFVYSFLVGQIDRKKRLGRVPCYVMNVDADWGGGKSFFLDGLALDLEAHGHLVARVNAWKDDHALDPYVAIMAAIDRVFQPFIKKESAFQKAWQATIKSGGSIALRTIGAAAKGYAKNKFDVDATQILSDAGAGGLADVVTKEALIEGGKTAASEIEKIFDVTLERMIDGFNQSEAAVESFREKLSAAIATLDTRRPPLFILVDELDRCKPSYAVQLLERVKHLFDVPNVIFVFATNSDQLRHSIGGAYGPQFNGYRYLKRFFERTYVFEEPSTDKYISAICDQMSMEKLKAPFDDPLMAVQTGCQAFKFDLRAISQILEMMDTAITAWPHKHPIDTVVLFSLCAHFYMTGKAEWFDERSGEFRSWSWVRNVAPFAGATPRQTVFSYVSAYDASMTAIHDLDEAPKLYQDKDASAMVKYAASVFEREWNGLHVKPGTPSVQQDLLHLVANAGRMTRKRQ